MITRRIVARSAAAMAVLAITASAQAADWFPQPVNLTTADGKTTQVEYQAQTKKASRNWKICVSYPHMKDPFFLASDYGAVEEAKRLGVSVQVLDAGGYTQLSNQISQIEDCVAGGANAVVMVAIAADGMDNLLRSLKEKNIVVVDAINGVTSKDVSARVLTNPHDEAMRAGQYLAKKHPKGTLAVHVGWLPGPAGAGFVEAFNAGFHEGIKGSAVVVDETKYGDVGKEVQGRLVEDMLQTHKDLDYVVGTAVMVEAAIPLLRARKLDKKVKLVSVYLTPGVYQALKGNRIEAAGVAPVVLTSRMQIDTAVRILEEGKNREPVATVNTLGKVYTPATVKEINPLDVLAPASFKPIFSFNGAK